MRGRWGQRIAGMWGEIGIGVHPIMAWGARRAGQELLEAAALSDVEYQMC